MTAQTEAVQAPAPELGRARLRKEDERLITGQTHWTDNIKLPGMLHMAFLRSVRNSGGEWAAGGKSPLATRSVRVIGGA